MGACTSKPGSAGSRSRQNSASTSSDSRRQSSGGNRKPASRASSSSPSPSSSCSSHRGSGDSISFLKKYSFATLNPAFADFEQEDEEAMSKLRTLAQESFCTVLRKGEEEVDGDIKCSVGQIVEGVMEEHQNLHHRHHVQQQQDRELRRRGSRHRTSAVVEETLVMSSSCLPDYSLGIVAVPESRSFARSSSARSMKFAAASLPGELLSRDSSGLSRRRHRHHHRSSRTGTIPF